MRTRRSVLATGSLLGLAGCLTGTGNDDGTGDGSENGDGDGTGDGSENGDGDGTGDGSENDDGDGGGDGDGTDGVGPSVSSPAFAAGTSIPARYTCGGADVSPPLRLAGTSDVASLAVVVEDPDAPTDEPFVHWLLWNVPPGIEGIPEGIDPEPTVDALDGAVQGTNDFGNLGYGGPCPPADDGPHAYEFTVLLLDTTLDIDPGADAGAFRDAVDSHVTGETTLTGTYDR